jgi:hypothetical protein
VIGGVVVHDPRLPALAGAFVYSDACNGELRAFTYANGVAVDDRELNLTIAGHPSTFAEGPDGRIYAGTSGGTVYRLDPGT